MAQTLEAFERDVEPTLPESAKPAVAEFKALVRHRFNALARDAVDIFSLDGEVNGTALHVRDHLSPVGRP